MCFVIKAMKNYLPAQSWLWPDRVIGKRESRTLRDEHNALVNSHAELLEQARGLLLQFRKLTGAGAINLDSQHWGMAAVHRDLLNAVIARAEGRAL